MVQNPLTNSGDVRDVGSIPGYMEGMEALIKDLAKGYSSQNVVTK